MQWGLFGFFCFRLYTNLVIEDNNTVKLLIAIASLGMKWKTVITIGDATPPPPIPPVTHRAIIREKAIEANGSSVSKGKSDLCKQKPF